MFYILLSSFLVSLENDRTRADHLHLTIQEGFEVPENGTAPVDEEETF